MIDVHGGVQKSGSPSFSPAPVTGAAVVADPLASLPLPGTSGLTNYGAENLSGASSATIKPGIYSSISVSGSAALTMNAGTYIIEGGGFSVSGAGSVTGSGVTIVNAGSDYPSAGGTYGSISLSGSGTYKSDPAHHRYLCRNRHLPDARQHQGDDRLGGGLRDDRHDLRRRRPRSPSAAAASSTRHSTSTP